MVLASWGIAFFEYCFQAPANRIGHEFFTAPQLKIMQEAITILVFSIFSALYLKESLRWNDIVGFVLILLAVIGSVTAYYMIPHVQSRIDRFINPQAGDTFQVRTALEAVQNGGLFGKGPGEGHIKNILPDAHTDFIMAVAAEEYGAIICVAVVILFAVIVLRGFFLIFKDKNLFTLLAVSGLLTQFGMQAFVNIASTLSLIPTKGMTLPFISYGGSSLVSLGFGMGMVLALTRTTNNIKGQT